MQIDRRSGVRAVLPRLLIKFSVTILVVMCAGGYYTVNQVAEKMRIIDHDNITAITDATTAGISEMIVTRDYSHLQETLRQSMDNKNIMNLAVTNLDGKVLSEMTRGVTKIAQLPEPVFNDGVLMVPEDNVTSTITRVGSVVTVWQPVDSLVHVGWMRITLSTRHYDSIISDLINIILLTVGTMLTIIVTTILYQYSRSYKRLRFYESHLLDAAHTDALTGLANRLMLGYYLNRSVTRATKSKQSFTVAFMDLDGFKSVNDTYGHAVGDELLIQVADRLRTTLRDDDQVVRLGGDEFVLIMNEVNHDITVMLLDRILTAIRETYSLSNDITVSISTSIGVAEYTNATDAHAMLTDADAAMYRAKAQGKNTVVFENKVS